MKPSSIFLCAFTAALFTACSSTPDASSSTGGGHDGASTSSGQGGASTSSGQGGASTTSTASASSSASTGSGVDALASSFVYVGCNRLSKADWDQASNPSSANVAQLTRTFADITALTDVPEHFFLAGDLALGLDTNTAVLAGQLDAWAALYGADTSGIAAKVPVIPLVGNHEMLAKVKVNGTKVELSNPGADDVWTSWVTGHGFAQQAGNGPTKASPNADALQDNQSKLTYSFDEGGIHYVVLNTDTWTSTPDATTGSTQTGWIAMTWLAGDLAAAQASPSVQHIVVLGHKPIVSPIAGAVKDDAINPAFTGPLETLLDQTAKVRGYFCAHAHLWDAQKLPGKRGVYQIIAGNGGSALESNWAPAFYGFTEVRFYQSGKVGVIRHDRPVPNPYNLPAAGPAQAQAEQTIVP